MKNQSLSPDIIQLNLNTLAKVEQAELIAKFAINTNASRDDALVAISCIADLLYDVLKKAK